jgi:hypothetical protein
MAIACLARASIKQRDLYVECAATRQTCYKLGVLSRIQSNASFLSIHLFATQ